jgi:hypothetical protein
MVRANGWEKLINLPKKQVSTFTWTSDHAAKVHEGWTLKNGDSAPARPWVWLTADSYDFKKELLELILKSNKNLSGAIEDAFVKLSINFGDEMQNNIQSPIWNWPRNTLRKSGELVGSPRNIVDLGDLINSYSITIK